MSDLDESALARRNAALPPAPDALVTAAQQLPAARGALDTLIARAESNLQERETIIRDLEAVLHAEGIVPHPSVIVVLHARLHKEPS